MNLLRLRIWLRDRHSVGLWVLLLAMMAIAIVGCQSSEEGTADAPTSVVEDVLPAGELFKAGFTPEGHVYKGNPDAAVVVEEFSSYQCPYCGRFFNETYPELMRKYVEQGKVQYIFRDFPLAGQPQSPKAAEAARCAAEVGDAQAFWDMHDQIFAGQREWSGSSSADQIFKNYAAQLGFDQAAFDDCLDSGRMADRVRSDWQDGMTRGVSGTPSFFINGQLLVGAQPISAFASAIDRALTGEPITAAEASPEMGSGDTPSADDLVPTPAVFGFEKGHGGDTVFALGDPAAPVTIVEFSDYQCPVCVRHVQETWPVLKEKYVDTGRVYYVLKDFPLTTIHPEAFKAHEAARCAQALGGDDTFWQMHDRLFENQQEWSGSSEYAARFEEYAAELGLDRSAFSTCLDGGQQSDAVQADLDEGLQLGVNGTPTFFIGGYPFSGAHPIQNFDQIITLAENGQLRDAIAEALAAAQAQREAEAQPRPTMAPADVPLGGAPAMGDPNAPITIVEYSDYQCPFCAQHYQQTLPQLLQNYIEAGKVRYVFKDFPLTSIHPQAVKAAEAARCARDIGGDDAYWDMHDRLFEGQDTWSGNPEHVTVFKDYAAALELDREAFDACLDSGRYSTAVQADFQEGAGFGVSGTPAFFVNRQPVQGAQPYGVFVQMIESFLNGD